MLTEIISQQFSDSLSFLAKLRKAKFTFKSCSYNLMITHYELMLLKLADHAQLFVNLLNKTK
jgi:hypothetical protein